MIKVNLAKKGMGGKKSGGGLGNFSLRSGGISDAGLADEFASVDNTNRTLLINLVLMLIGVLALYIYEQSNVPPLRSSATSLRRQLDEVKKKNVGAADVVKEIARFESEQTVLQNQINAIEAIKRDRLREVRVLDYIQREIPEKVWLQRMDLNQGRLSIAGYATTDSELTTFMEGLQRSAYLKEIQLVRSTEATVAEIGAVKRFEIVCNMDRSQ
ncbi:MAG: PilN domain-containing protein [Bdellovibrionaceae bacterium]|nr:PilN domain-containing protein [Pseudobdellovibrionaceae bacterium]